MMEDLQALRLGTAPDANGATESARNEFLNAYAQAQMLVPDSVLKASQSVRVALADARKRMEDLREEPTHSQEHWQEIHQHLIQVWSVLTEMQTAMRQDLGIATSPPS